MSEVRYLTFALGKGRLANKTLELLEKIGITCEEIKDKNSRKLVFVNEELKLKFFLAKGPDVPTYVEYGAADIGVVGKDTLLEEGKQVYEVLDLGFGKCRMCVKSQTPFWRERRRVLQRHRRREERHQRSRFARFRDKSYASLGYDLCKYGISLFAYRFLRQSKRQECGCRQ